MKNVWALLLIETLYFKIQINFTIGSLDSHASNVEDSNFEYIVSELGADKLEILEIKVHVLMTGEIHMKNLIINNYLQKNVFIHH